MNKKIIEGRGKFISFEGPEGSGKTTQARRLITRLEENGLEVVYTREPGGTPTGEAIREILQHDKTGDEISPKAEVLLFAASRAQLVSHVILPALERGAWVVCDRFADSTTAYQGYGRGFEVEQMIAINQFAIGNAVPDKTILLDLDPNNGFKRVAQRLLKNSDTLDRIESEARSFHERVRNGYIELAGKWPERFRIIDASRDEDTVFEDIRRIVRDEFGI